MDIPAFGRLHVKFEHLAESCTQQVVGNSIHLSLQPIHEPSARMISNLAPHVQPRCTSEFLLTLRPYTSSRTSSEGIYGPENGTHRDRVFLKNTELFIGPTSTWTWDSTPRLKKPHTGGPTVNAPRWRRVDRWTGTAGLSVIRSIGTGCGFGAGHGRATAVPRATRQQHGPGGGG